MSADPRHVERPRFLDERNANGFVVEAPAAELGVNLPCTDLLFFGATLKPTGTMRMEQSARMGRAVSVAHAEGATYSHFVLRMKDREALILSVLRKGIQLGRLIEYCIPEMPAYRGRSGEPSACPVARKAARCAVNLPVWLGRDEDRSAVVAAIQEQVQG